MGRLNNSCLKLLVCTRGGGAGAADSAGAADDVDVDEGKVISDKRRWSFRKRSTRHRVLSNSVISDTTSFTSDKENTDVATNPSYLLERSSAPEKITEEEKPNDDTVLSNAEVNTEETNLLSTDGSSHPVDQRNLEPAAIFVQAAVRGYLARKELRKLKSLVKMQAAVRGYLVRREAAETLRCAFAIIKMQALVRARQARQLVEKSGSQVSGNCYVEPKKTYSSAEKLLLNAFACQIMKTMPRTKPIHTKCDPSKSNSAWKWLERWMSVSSSNINEWEKEILTEGYQGQGESTEPADDKVLHGLEFGNVTLSSKSNLTPSELIFPSESEVMSTNISSGAFEFHAPISTPDNCSSCFEKDEKETKLLENEVAAVGIMEEGHSNIESASENTITSLPGQKYFGTDDKSESYGDSLKQADKVASYEPLENAGKKFLNRKSSNPAFAAAQLKFEELSGSNAVKKSLGSTYQDNASKAKVSSFNSHVDCSTGANSDVSLSENLVPHHPRVQSAASECGTEISISSTLDSPDRSETEGGEIVLEIGALEKHNYDNNGGADNNISYVNMHDGTKNSDFEVHQLQKSEEDDENLASAATAVDSMHGEQQSAVETTLDLQDKLEKSPQGTPRSSTTVTELHDTPSSQTSINAKKGKRDNDIPSKKQRSRAVSKKLISSVNNDLGGRSSTESLVKDSKNTKRRNLVVTTKPDHADHEPRISNSNPLPSYMQATESAKAKLHLNVSPKLSPDVPDDQRKKRNSFPVGDGKQSSSPRMQRSTSQAQHNVKVNGTHSPHSSTERRWQR
ncbi:protein IQ-DOMAIN 32 [Ananas comosus]|uniref:Protein IQ-DOMAIN 32 n=1 Tax=Ananas comosus TaxID=4615 RepID=A0A6P5H5U5_ANACO|nr:protein IQ-DOMAIN 32 [Ananas comosus]